MLWDRLRAEETRLLERHRADSEAWAITTGSFAAVFFLVTAVVFALCGLLMKMALSSQAQADRLLQSFSRSSTAPTADKFGSTTLGSSPLLHEIPAPSRGSG